MINHKHFAARKSLAPKANTTHLTCARYAIDPYDPSVLEM
jgi:hypothetical protein